MVWLSKTQTWWKRKTLFYGYRHLYSSFHCLKVKIVGLMGKVVGLMKDELAGQIMK